MIHCCLDFGKSIWIKSWKHANIILCRFYQYSENHFSDIRMSLHMDDLLIIRCILKYCTYADYNVPNNHYSEWFMLQTSLFNFRVLFFSGGNFFRNNWLHASAVFPWVKELYIRILKKELFFLSLAKNHFNHWCNTISYWTTSSVSSFSSQSQSIKMVFLLWKYRTMIKATMFR